MGDEASVLGQTFVALRDDGADGRALDEALRKVAEEGRRAWPGVEVLDAALGAWLAERVPDREDVATAMGELHAADLYLACACALGDAAALAAFEAKVLPAIGPAVARIDPDAAFGREIAAEVRVKLLVDGEAGPARIRNYLGRGPLSAFVQVAAMRLAYSAKRAAPADAPEDVERLAALPFEGDDAEMARLRAECAEPFGRAFREALAGLPPRERNVLRLHVLEGLSSETIARMYRVHRATVARWVADAHDALLRETRARLSRELRLRPGEFESLMRLVQSRLDVSIVSVLDRG